MTAPAAPSVPSLQRKTQVLIIGGGPGGYVAGIRCGQLGLDTILVDDRPLGGTCLNIGCIPSKALIHAADEFAKVAESGVQSPLGISTGDPSIDLAVTTAWKDSIVARLNRGVGSLLKRAGTEVIRGRASVVDGKTCDITLVDDPGQGPVRVVADHLVIATGSRPIELPGLGFGPRVMSSTEVLSLSEVPAALAVVGGGYIGVELGTALAKLGTHVTIVEAEDRLLPLYDADLTAPVALRLDELDVSIMTSSRANGLTDDGLRVVNGDGDTVEVTADSILVTVGRRPVTDGWGLEELRLANDGPFIVVDDQCRTSMRDVWAIGDVTGEPMLAHRAMRQGEVVAEAIAGKASVFDPETIPAIVFSDPEIVVAGLSPTEAEAAYGQIVVGRFPLSANGRAMTLERTAGFVRVVARADNHLVVGLQAVGTSVAELSASFGLAIEMGAQLEDLAGTIHAHPTLGEAIPEAANTALGHPLHF